MSISVRPNSKSILHGQWARFIFIAGRLCIDFTQTGGETGKRAAWERFHQPSDLADWFAESPLQVQDIQVNPEEFTLSLALREAIWRVAQAIGRNETPITADIAVINHVASAPDLPPKLVLDAPNLKQSWHTPITATGTLSIIARDAIDLFASELRSRIRECANPNCGLIFVDASRPGERRWCLMKRCGNMAKTSQYRKTKKHS